MTKKKKRLLVVVVLAVVLVALLAKTGCELGDKNGWIRDRHR